MKKVNFSMSFFKKTIGSHFRRFLTSLSPRLNNEVVFYIKFRRKLNLERPTTLNEKILWLKFNEYRNNPLVKQCANKLEVRDYIKEKGEDSLLNDMINVYSKPEEIDWDSLPKSFAVKLNVGSGCNRIVRNKEKVDKREISSLINQWLKKNHWAGYAELQYRDVEPKILIEKFIGDPFSPVPPKDYKFYCMNGRCEVILVCLDRGVKTKRHSVKYFFMDRNWNLLPYTPEAFEYTDIVIDKPAELDCAIEKAEKLAADFPFVRVDFYLEEHKIIFGELTFTPAGAMDTELCLIPPGQDRSVDVILGEKLHLDFN